jgi:hypothetical protein
MYEENAQLGYLIRLKGVTEFFDIGFRVLQGVRELSGEKNFIFQPMGWNMIGDGVGSDQGV